MTKLAILSDIHGNLPALNAVAADFAQAEVDHVVIAGDVINLGPFSAAVVERVLERNWMDLLADYAQVDRWDYRLLSHRVNVD